MNRNLKTLVPVLCVGMFIHIGCAKQQSVKVDPSLAPAVTSATQASAGPAVSSQAQQPAGAAQASQEAPAGQTASAQPATAGREQPARASVLEKIYFDFDSASLSETARATLAANFDTLQANPQGSLRIEGHCDERGSDEYNLALSERRAQAALKYLQALGAPAERLSSVGYGEERPAAPGTGEQAWAKNRRDEFTVIK